MSPYRIIIVDDQTEIRRMLRAFLESLGSGYEIMDMPSGEEALLEVSRRPVHLLITDMRLPGMTGMDLMKKMQVRAPNIKVIVITGLSDPRIREDASQAGVAAFLVKPVGMTDFINAVQQTLRVVKGTGILPQLPTTVVTQASLQRQPQKPQPPARPAPSLGDKLAGLRVKTRSKAVVLLDLHGKAVAQAGDQRDVFDNSTLLPALNAVFGTLLQVSRSMGMTTPQSLVCLPGGKYNLSLAHVGQSHGLLVIRESQGKRPGQKEEYPTGDDLIILGYAQELLSILERMGVAKPAAMGPEVSSPGLNATGPGGNGSGTGLNVSGLKPGVVQQEPEPPDIPEDVEVTEQDLMAVEALFQKGTPQNQQLQDINSFWETANEDAGLNGGNSAAISYEQARKLGLAPENEEKK